MLAEHTIEPTRCPDRRGFSDLPDRAVRRFNFDRDHPAEAARATLAPMSDRHTQKASFAATVAKQYRASRSRDCRSGAVDLAWVSANFLAWRELEPLPVEDSFLLSLDLGGCGRRQQFGHKSSIWEGDSHAHSVHLFELCNQPRVRLQGRLDVLLLRLPRAEWEELVLASPASLKTALRSPPRSCDSILCGLGTALVSAMDEPATTARLYLDQLTMAFVRKALASYFAPRESLRCQRGALSPWQERRAKDFLEANLSNDVTLEHVANECQLSPAHFSRAFKRATGKSPHLWLIERRVEAAKALLRESDIALAEIALTCGFGDQSHFTRVFHRAVGSSPGLWRRHHSRELWTMRAPGARASDSGQPYQSTLQCASHRLGT